MGNYIIFIVFFLNYIWKKSLFLVYLKPETSATLNSARGVGKKIVDISSWRQPPLTTVIKMLPPGPAHFIFPNLFVCISHDAQSGSGASVGIKKSKVQVQSQYSNFFTCSYSHTFFPKNVLWFFPNTFVPNSRCILVRLGEYSGERWVRTNLCLPGWVLYTVGHRQLSC